MPHIGLRHRRRGRWDRPITNFFNIGIKQKETLFWKMEVDMPKGIKKPNSLKKSAPVAASPLLGAKGGKSMG
jgi:hypothetical protein